MSLSPSRRLPPWSLIQSHLTKQIFIIWRRYKGPNRMPSGRSVRQSIPAIRSRSAEIQHTNAYNSKYHGWSWRMPKLLSGSVLEEGAPACCWRMKRRACAQSCSQNICIFLGWAGNSSWSWFSAGKWAKWPVVLCQRVRLRSTSHVLCELPQRCPQQATRAWQTLISLATALPPKTEDTEAESGRWV